VLSQLIPPISPSSFVMLVPIEKDKGVD